MTTLDVASASYGELALFFEGSRFACSELSSAFNALSPQLLLTTGLPWSACLVSGASRRCLSRCFARGSCGLASVLIKTQTDDVRADILFKPVNQSPNSQSLLLRDWKHDDG